MEDRAERLCRAVCLFAANAGDRLCIVLARSAAAVGQVPIMNLIAVGPQQHQRSGHEEFDIVGMCGNGDGGGHGGNRWKRKGRGGALSFAKCLAAILLRLLNEISGGWQRVASSRRII